MSIEERWDQYDRRFRLKGLSDSRIAAFKYIYFTGVGAALDLVTDPDVTAPQVRKAVERAVAVLEELGDRYMPKP